MYTSVTYIFFRALEQCYQAKKMSWGIKNPPAQNLLTQLPINNRLLVRAFPDSPCSGESVIDLSARGMKDDLDGFAAQLHSLSGDISRDINNFSVANFCKSILHRIVYDCVIFC